MDEELQRRSGESGHRDSTWVGQARDGGALLPTIKLLQGKAKTLLPSKYLIAFCTALEGS